MRCTLDKTGFETCCNASVSKVCYDKSDSIYQDSSGKNVTRTYVMLLLHV